MLPIQTATSERLPLMACAGLRGLQVSTGSTLYRTLTVVTLRAFQLNCVCVCVCLSCKAYCFGNRFGPHGFRNYIIFRNMFESDLPSPEAPMLFCSEHGSRSFKIAISQQRVCSVHEAPLLFRNAYTPPDFWSLHFLKSVYFVKS